MSRLIRGTMILTAATFFSKFIGLIFIIPFTALVKDSGVALYGYAYNPYTILLSLSTMGIPLAVSKFVSKYNALGDYNTGRRLLKSGLLIMTLTGCIAFIILYCTAPYLSEKILIVQQHGKGGNSLSDITFVMRMVSTALILVPAMSLIRGYFQGFQSMGPTAVSQVVEQIVRIVFIFVGSYIVLYVLKGTITAAVGMATFAATIGAVAGLIVLLWYWKKRSPHLKKLYDENKVDSGITLVDMYKETITYAIPFVAVGLAIPIYQMVDQFTIVKALEEIHISQANAEAVFANFTQIAHKIVMIPVSLATSLALTLIPVITQSYIQKDMEELNKQITQTFQITLFLTVPSAIGLTILAYPSYGALFGMKSMDFGGYYLFWYSPTAIWFAIFSVTAAILQGLNKQKFALFSLMIGFLAKMITNTPFLHAFQGVGAVFATNLGYILSIIFNLYIIKKYGEFSFKWVIRRSVLIGLFTTVMGIAVWVVKAGLEHLYGTHYTRGEAVLTVLVGIIVGGASYFYLSYSSGLMTTIFGNRIRFLSKRRQKTTA